MTVTREMLVTELQNLLRRTAFEQTIATLRRTQARTTDLEAELAANVGKARERAALLSTAIRDLGGVPDVVGSALARAGALAQVQLNQVQSLQGALLGDLGLEHQLRERTRFARALAEELRESSVLPVLDRLETAHSATIGWLEERLAEVGSTGTSLLRATPVQLVVGSARHAAGLPLRSVARGLNAASGLVARLAHRSGADEVVQDAVQAADAAVDKGVHVARVASQTVQDTVGEVVDLAQDTPKDPAATAAQVTEQVLEQTGGTADIDERHPFAAYERLSGDSIIRHINDIDDVEELRQTLAYEQAHKARKGVLAAAQERLQEQAVGTSS